MKIIVFIFIVLFNTNLFSQIIINDSLFKKKIFSLMLIKRDAASKKKFNNVKHLFANFKKNGLVSSADYRNFAVTLSYLEADKNLINYAIDKAFTVNYRAMYSFYDYLKKKNPKQYEKELKRFPTINNRLLEVKDRLLEVREKQQLKVHKDTFNIKSYCKVNNLDVYLVKLINSIHKDDQKYRKQDYKKNLTKQNKLDSLNLSKIDSLYKNYHTYIGTTLVGEDLNYVMWLVIQHSNIKKMEEYLPVIANAATNKEVSSVPLAMLVDRVYTIKYGYQIFGSQHGVKLGDDNFRKIIKSKYNLEGFGR